MNGKKRFLISRRSSVVRPTPGLSTTGQLGGMLILKPLDVIDLPAQHRQQLLRFGRREPNLKEDIRATLRHMADFSVGVHNLDLSSQGDVSIAQTLATCRWQASLST
jgi:hypothetical protein